MFLVSVICLCPGFLVLVAPSGFVCHCLDWLPTVCYSVYDLKNCIWILNIHVLRAVCYNVYVYGLFFGTSIACWNCSCSRCNCSASCRELAVMRPALSIDSPLRIQPSTWNKHNQRIWKRHAMDYKFSQPIRAFRTFRKEGLHRDCEERCCSNI